MTVQQDKTKPDPKEEEKEKIDKKSSSGASFLGYVSEEDYNNLRGRLTSRKNKSMRRNGSVKFYPVVFQGQNAKFVFFGSYSGGFKVFTDEAGDLFSIQWEACGEFKFDDSAKSIALSETESIQFMQ